ASALTAAEAPPNAASAQTQQDIAVLVERQIIQGPEYWTEHSAKGGKCDGAKVAVLLTHVAKVFKPVNNTEEAIAVLLERGVISSPDYWKPHALEGAICDGGNVAAVLGRIASRLPVVPPKSANAKPLDPVAANQLKDKYDIVIAGAGTGGCGAAVQATRMG